MSPNPFGNLPTADRLPSDPQHDEGVMVDGLERALAQARTKIPDHDTAATLGFPARREDAVRALKAEVPAPVPFDSRAVMDVLRGAIDRYTHGGGHEQGAWVEELAKAKDKATDLAVRTPPPRHLEAGYAPDRRRLAAVVIAVFLIVGGVAYMQFGIGGGSEKVKTEPRVTVQGRAVTTVTVVPSTASTTTAPTTETTVEAAPAGTVEQSTSTTTRRATATTAPPATDPPTTADTTPPTTEPPTTDTTPTTEPPSTTPTTADCAIIPKPEACP